jgi:SPOR domain
MAAAGNAPLSLSPEVASAEASARPAFPPPPKTAPAAPTRVAAVPPAATASAAYGVQISSQRSETEAQASFRTIQAKFPSLLGDRQPIIRRADLGDKGIYFRTMVGPFASVDEATQFCGSLKSAGGQCVVQRN